MADDVLLNAGTGGETVATDSDGVRQYQWIKLVWGPNDTFNKVDDATGKRLPVTGLLAGDVAHDGIDTGNPVKVGHKAVAIGTSPTAVAAGDRTDSYANRHGVPFVQVGHPNIVTFRTQISATQTNAALITQATGGKIVLTHISVAGDNDNTDNVSVRIGFGTASTPTGAGVVFSHPGLPAGFISHCGNGGGIIGMGADDEDLRVTTGTIATDVIDVWGSYYVLPS